MLGIRDFDGCEMVSIGVRAVTDQTRSGDCQDPIVRDGEIGIVRGGRVFQHGR